MFFRDLGTIDIQQQPQSSVAPRVYHHHRPSSINGEEGFYSVHEEEPYCYALTTTTQQIYLGFFAEQKS